MKLTGATPEGGKNMKLVPKSILITQEHNEWLRREVFRRKPSEPRVSESQIIREALDRMMKEKKR